MTSSTCGGGGVDARAFEEAEMIKLRIVAIATALAIAASCKTLANGTAPYEDVAPAVAAKSVVLHVNNGNIQTVEIRTVINSQTRFVGTVAPKDSMDIVLDGSQFPNG